MRAKHVLFATVIGGAALFGTYGTLARQPVVTVRTATTPILPDTLTTPVLATPPAEEVVTAPVSDPEPVPALVAVPAVTATTPEPGPAPMTSTTVVKPVTPTPVTPIPVTHPKVVGPTPIPTIPACNGVGDTSGCLPGNKYIPDSNHGIPAIDGQPCSDCQARSAAALYINPSNGSCVTTGPSEAAAIGLVLDPTCGKVRPAPATTSRTMTAA